MLELLNVKFENNLLTCDAVLDGRFKVSEISYNGKDLHYPGSATWRASNGRHEAILLAVQEEYTRHRPVQVAAEK